MKKLLLLLVLAGILAFACAKPAAADINPLTTDLGTKGAFILGPSNLKAGTYYDAWHKEVLAGAQVSVLDFKRLLSLDIGVLTDAHSNPILAGLGADATTLAKICKLNYNLPFDLHLGVWGARDLTLGWKEGGRWGFSATVLATF